MKFFLCLSCIRLNIFDPKSIAGRCIEKIKGAGNETDYSKVEQAYFLLFGTSSGCKYTSSR